MYDKVTFSEYQPQFALFKYWLSFIFIRFIKSISSEVSALHVTKAQLGQSSLYVARWQTDSLRSLTWYLTTLAHWTIWEEVRSGCRVLPHLEVQSYLRTTRLSHCTKWLWSIAPWSVPELFANYSISLYEVVVEYCLHLEVCPELLATTRLSHYTKWWWSIACTSKMCPELLTTTRLRWTHRLSSECGIQWQVRISVQHSA